MSLEIKMNLVSEPWIPVTTQSGAFEKISLMQALCEGEKYSDLAVRPHERVALMRLLICIAHASLKGPEDYEAWEKIPQTLPKAAQEYLEKWKDFFWLFHSTQPFLQIAGLKRSDGKDDLTPTSSLVFSFASGNNTTLFDHYGQNESQGRFLTYSELAISLITFQNYYMAGGQTPSMNWGGIDSPAKPNNPKDGPCVKESMAHAFIIGTSLIDTLQKNMPQKDMLQIRYSSINGDWWGHPIWEKFPSKRDQKDNIYNATHTYLGRLVPLTRLILLKNQESMVIGESLFYPSFKDKDFPSENSASIIVQKNKKELFAIKRNKSVWRELPSLIIKRKFSNGQEIGGPLCLSLIDNQQAFDLYVMGVKRTDTGGNGFLEIFESRFNIPAKMNREIGQNLYANMVLWAEQTDKKIGTAVSIYRTNYDGGWEGRLKQAGSKKGELFAKLKNKASIHYWTILENHKHLLTQAVESLENPDKVELLKKEWKNKVFKAALESYQLACDQETPRGMQAFALGLKVLNKKIKS